MKIYKPNISRFLNLTFLLACFSIDPIYFLIIKFFPLSMILPFAFGSFMGIMDNKIDWDQI